MNRITRAEQIVNSHTHAVDYRTLYFDTEADAAAYDASICAIPARKSRLDMSKIAAAQKQADAIRDSFTE